ncbi:MAG: Rap1a/Tai family immunity protein [Candidatus Korobacteraceae bacterium]|jgi:hypothetical protein
MRDMKTLLMPIAMLVALAISMQAAQKVVDGETLQQFCTNVNKVQAKVQTSQAEFGEGSFCVGYIRGVVDAMSTWKQLDAEQKSHTGQPEHPCIPDESSPEQIAKIVIKYLEDNPDKLHWQANVLIFASMRKAFPCK